MKNIQIAFIILCLSFSGCSDLVKNNSRTAKSGDAQQAPDLLSIDKLREIIQGSHSDALDVEALKIYPKARKYEVVTTSTYPDGREVVRKMAPTEKWVNGRYIVSEDAMWEGTSSMAMVVEYHEETQTYRRYIVIDDKFVTVIMGLRVGDTRSISWIDLDSKKYSQKWDSLSYETHTDDKSVWKSLYYSGTALQWTVVGEAKVIE